MAVTKIWNIKDSITRVVDYAMNPEKTTDDTVLRHDLSQVLDYAENADKTDHFCYVTGVNCIPETAAQQMAMPKQRYGKTGGNVAFHASQSFKPGEVTADQCHQIGVELAQKLWGDRLEVVVATHLNTGCLHNHFVLNSESFRDGKRYNDCKVTYREFRRLSDEICRKHSLSVIENPQKKQNATQPVSGGKGWDAHPVQPHAAGHRQRPRTLLYRKILLSGAKTHGLSGTL